MPTPEALLTLARAVYGRERVRHWAQQVRVLVGERLAHDLFDPLTNAEQFVAVEEWLYRTGEGFEVMKPGTDSATKGDVGCLWLQPGCGIVIGTHPTDWKQAVIACACAVAERMEAKSDE